MALTTDQLFKALAIVPKPASVLSFLGASYIIYHVFFDALRRSKVRFRVLMGMSLCDLINAVTTFLSTWPIPVDKAGPVYGAAGNHATCTVQGFFIQFSVSSALYNASLALCYDLTVRFGWKDHQLKKIEPFMHALPIIWALATATTGAALDAYHNAILWCSWAPPAKNYDIYRWVFFYGPTWVAIIYSLWVMTSISLKVFRNEKAVKKYTPTQSRPQQRLRRTMSITGSMLIGYEKAKAVAIQGFFYCFAFMNTWTLVFVVRVLLVVDPTYVNLPLTIAAAGIVCAQGFANYLVFRRPHLWSKASKICGHCCMRQEKVTLDVGKKENDAGGLDLEDGAGANGENGGDDDEGDNNKGKPVDEKFEAMETCRDIELIYW